MRRRLVRHSVLLALAATIGLTGCTSAEQTVQDQVDASVAAVATARLALEQLADGRSYPPTVDTALLDALTQLEDASGSLAEVVPESGAQSLDQRTALANVHAAISTISGARWLVAEGAGLAGVLADLEDILQQLGTKQLGTSGRR